MVKTKPTSLNTCFLEPRTGPKLDRLQISLTKRSNLLTSNRTYRYSQLKQNTIHKTHIHTHKNKKYNIIIYKITGAHTKKENKQNKNQHACAKDR